MKVSVVIAAFFIGFFCPILFLNFFESNDDRCANICVLKDDDGFAFSVDSTEVKLFLNNGVISGVHWRQKFLGMPFEGYANIQLFKGVDHGSVGTPNGESFFNCTNAEADYFQKKKNMSMVECLKNKAIADSLAALPNSQ